MVYMYMFEVHTTHWSTYFKHFSMSINSRRVFSFCFSTTLINTLKLLTLNYICSNKAKKYIYINGKHQDQQKNSGPESKRKKKQMINDSGFKVER